MKPDRRSSDAGLSFIEILVAVVILGTATMGILPLLSANVSGSGLQDRFAGARRWLVSAGDYAATDNLVLKSCTSNTTPNIISSYRSTLQTAAAPNRPAGWVDSQLTVTGVLFWNGTTFTSTCAESTWPALKMQQISLKVVSADGRVSETLDVVKDLVNNV